MVVTWCILSLYIPQMNEVFIKYVSCAGGYWVLWVNDLTLLSATLFVFLVFFLPSFHSSSSMELDAFKPAAVRSATSVEITLNFGSFMICFTVLLPFRWGQFRHFQSIVLFSTLVCVPLLEVIVTVFVLFLHLCVYPCWTLLWLCLYFFYTWVCTLVGSDCDCVCLSFFYTCVCTLVGSDCDCVCTFSTLGCVPMLEMIVTVVVLFLHLGVYLCLKWLWLCVFVLFLHLGVYPCWKWLWLCLYLAGTGNSNFGSGGGSASSISPVADASSFTSATVTDGNLSSNAGVSVFFNTDSRFPLHPLPPPSPTTPPTHFP